MEAVEAVDAEIRHKPAAVIPEPAKGVNESVLVERNGGGRAEEKVPIRAGRRIGIGNFADAIRIHVDVVPDANETDRAENAAGDDGLNFAVMRRGAVLSADLDDAVVFP